MKAPGSSCSTSRSIQLSSPPKSWNETRCWKRHGRVEGEAETRSKEVRARAIRRAYLCGLTFR